MDRDAGKRLDDLAVSFGKLRESINEAVKNFIDDDTIRTVLAGFTNLVTGITRIFSGLSGVLAPALGLGAVIGGIKLAGNVIRPSARNIELKNNRVRIQENTQESEEIPC